MELHDIESARVACGALLQSERHANATTHALKQATRKTSYFADGDPSLGHWFIPDLVLLGPQSATLIRFIEEAITAYLPRRRVRKAADAATHFRHIMMVVANALAMAWHRNSGRVAYSRANGAYTDKAIWPDWLSGRMLKQAVDELAALNLLTSEIGAWGSRSSLFEAADNFLEFAAINEVDATNLSLVMPPSSLVRLKDRNKQFQSFDQTDEIEGWISFLQTHNEFIGSQKIELRIPEQLKDKFLMTLGARHELAAIELYRTSLYRVFNDSTFKNGGRLYGGWWQKVPKAYRQFIVINDEPVCELDFSGFVIRSIYHQLGLDYREDPYQLEEITAYAVGLGFEPDHFRSDIKDLAQALLNGEPGGHSELIRLKHSFRPRYKRTEIQQMLELKHAPISWAFKTEEGKRNQRLDSDIAMNVLQKMTYSQVPCLSIHDSFIVQFGYIDKLRNQMANSYRSMLPFDAIIKNSY